jgi:amidophosphoribosyltransferase
MPAASELIASRKNEDEMVKTIGADWLVYQTLEDLIEAVTYEETGIEAFETSCFSGEYITNDITEHYLNIIELKRNDAAKAQQKEMRKQLEINDPSIAIN